MCEKGTLEIVAVIELDDKTHAGKEDKDAFRDSIVEAAGLPTFPLEIQGEADAR